MAFAAQYQLDRSMPTSSHYRTRLSSAWPLSIIARLRSTLSDRRPWPKKSRSITSSPIFACKRVTSFLWARSEGAAPRSNVV